VKIEKQSLKNENQVKRQQFLQQCQAEKNEMHQQLEEVEAAKAKRRTDRMEAHAKWVAENPGGAMAKVQEHQEENLKKAEMGREEARQHEAMLEQRAQYFLEMNTQMANQIKADKEGVGEAAKRKAREDKMDLANERKQFSQVSSAPPPPVDDTVALDTGRFFNWCSPVCLLLCLGSSLIAPPPKASRLCACISLVVASRPPAGRYCVQRQVQREAACPES